MVTYNADENNNKLVATITQQQNEQEQKNEQGDNELKQADEVISQQESPSVKVIQADKIVAHEGVDTGGPDPFDPFPMVPPCVDCPLPKALQNPKALQKLEQDGGENLGDEQVMLTSDDADENNNKLVATIAQQQIEQEQKNEQDDNELKQADEVIIDQQLKISEDSNVEIVRDDAVVDQSEDQNDAIRDKLEQKVKLAQKNTSEQEQLVYDSNDAGDDNGNDAGDDNGNDAGDDDNGNDAGDDNG